MIDPAHKFTDKEIEKFEKRASRIYLRAERKCKKLLRDYLKPFAKQDKAMKAKVDSGEITKEEWLTWRMMNISRGKKYREMLDKTARIMSRANKEALEGLNDQQNRIFAENYNYALYEIWEQMNG